MTTSSGQHIFGQYRPGNTVWHRIPAGVTMALAILVPLLAVLVQRWWLSALVALLMLTAVASLPGRAWPLLRMPTGLVILSAALVCYHAWLGQGWLTGVVLAVNLLCCLYASRIVLTTIPVPVMVDQIESAVGVLARLPLLGRVLNPRQVAMAVALMLRSIPELIGSVQRVRDAGRARGVRMGPVRLVTPVVIDAVALAHRSGEALVARGLLVDERRQSERIPSHHD
ncbi:energy-coupling factor transporter transmembrane component T family protein [Parenemella sanctibonifatiensis]|nr:energy-coupling factor transporter transmembrane component T [Parenemella sanctibonifatiensis]